jgi:hypothetical protein
MGCKHIRFYATVKTGRMVADGEEAASFDVMPLDFTVDVKVKCEDCGKLLLFRGMQGFNAQGMAVSFDRTEARLTADIEP